MKFFSDSVGDIRKRSDRAQRIHGICNRNDRRFDVPADGLFGRSQARRGLWEHLCDRRRFILCGVRPGPIFFRSDRSRRRISSVSFSDFFSDSTIQERKK